MEERRLKNILKTNVKMCIILIFGYTFFMILQNQSTDTIIAVDVLHTVVYLVASYNCYDDIKNSSTIKSCLLGHTLTVVTAILIIFAISILLDFNSTLFIFIIIFSYYISFLVLFISNKN